MKRQFILLGTLAVLAACNEPTVRKEGFGVHGIDVSHYQKQVDWPLVATQDVKFAFVKATEGETMQDTIFCQNWDAMRAAGMVRGAYHFFRPGISAALQARNFIATVDLQHGDLPPVLDVEVTDGYPSEALAAGIKTWLTIVGDAWKIKPIVYTNQKFYNQHLAGQVLGYPVWVARYSDERHPDLANGLPWVFWQYGNRGRLLGIAGDVDFNVFNGSLNDLQALTLCRPAPLLDRMPEPVPPPTPTAPAVELGEPIAANP
ncbi:MAG: glycoside hydrolase family 25 protein [Saprospiraceae bacterium]|nr:glycoside hydrolase family 25 protein [Saprospiraceae bacterium]